MKKAPAKKAPAKKAPVKNAPAKKAPAKVAPVKSAPAKKAPATKGVAPVGAAVKGPAKKAAAHRPVQRLMPEPPASVWASDLVPGLREHPVPGRASGRDRLPAWARLLVAATVLLLAAAAGLGTAAIIKSRPQSWESTAAMQLLPGEAPTLATAEAMASSRSRYVARVAGATALVAGEAGIADSDVRGQLRATTVGPDQILVTARAVHPREAERLAATATDALVTGARADQLRVVPVPGDRLIAVISQSPTAAELKSITDSRVGLAGALAAAVVLALASLVLVLRRL